MIEGLFWMLVALVLGLPGFVGVYLLFTSPDNLSVKYQNYRLAKTHQPLKDEDFSNMPSIILRLKMAGSALLIISVSLFAALLYFTNKSHLL